MTKDAVLLGGPLGLGHEMMARSCAEVLERSGWRTRRLDSMSLLGPWHGGVGRRALPPPGRRPRPVRRAALRPPADRQPAGRSHGPCGHRPDGAGAPRRSRPRAGRPDHQRVRHRRLGGGQAQGGRARPAHRGALHRRGGAPDVGRRGNRSVPGDLARRRGIGPALPAAGGGGDRAAVGAVRVLLRSDAGAGRAALGVPSSDFCVLAMDSGWGFGPLVESVQALAEAGVHVLAVAGRDQRMERRFRELAARTPRITPFGYTDRIPELMAAADLVIALPGAITCGEARVVGRPLLLLDVMPGHGRDNLLHELELGGAHACVPTPHGVTASVLALRGEGGMGWAKGVSQTPAAPRRRAGSPPWWRPCSGSALTCSLPPRPTSPSRPGMRPDHQ